MSIGVHLGVIWMSYWYVQMRGSRIQTPSHSYTKESNKRAHSYTWHYKMKTHSYPAFLISITICLIFSTATSPYLDYTVRVNCGVSFFTELIERDMGKYTQLQMKRLQTKVCAQSTG